MQTIRTIVCKLTPSLEQQGEIEVTLTAFACACNAIADVCRALSSTNKVEVQQACYRTIRADFGLSANLAILAIARTCATLKEKDRPDSTFHPTSIDYDARIFSFRESDWTFSLTLLYSRQRIACRLGNHQRQVVKGHKPTSAVLVKLKDGRYFLHVQVSEGD